LARTAAGLDRERRVRIEPYQAFAEVELARVGLDYARCDRAVQLVDPGGRAHSGAVAVNRFLWTARRLRPLVALLYVLPLLLVAEVGVYAVVARNRHRVSRWLGLDACRIAAPGPTAAPGARPAADG
jgi:hypothetical protein